MDKTHLDRTQHTNLYYPRLPSSEDKIEVGLMSVRAADSIQISYDFDRDGWVVKQASIFVWEPDDLENERDWQEVAFIPAWGRKRTDDI